MPPPIPRPVPTPRPTITITQRREIERQPIQRPPIPREPTSGDLTEVLLADAEREVGQVATSWMTQAVQEYTQALSLQRQGNQLVEETDRQRNDQQQQALVESFAPDRADIGTVQSMAFNPRSSNLSLADMWEASRLEEGRRNLSEFNRSVERMPQESRQFLSPLAAGLQKEGMTGETFKATVDTMRRGGEDQARQQYGAGVVDKVKNISTKLYAEFSFLPEEQRPDLPFEAGGRTPADVGRGILAGYEKVREIEAPVGKFIGEAVAETFGIPGTDLNLLKIPGAAGVAMELGRPTNWVPIPFVDPAVARAIGIVGTPLAKAGARIAPEALQTLIQKATAFAARESGASRRAADKFVKESREALTARGARLAPSVPEGAVRGVAPDVVPPRAREAPTTDVLAGEVREDLGVFRDAQGNLVKAAPEPAAVPEAAIAPEPEAVAAQRLADGLAAPRETGVTRVDVTFKGKQVHPQTRGKIDRIAARSQDELSTFLDNPNLKPEAREYAESLRVEIPEPEVIPLPQLPKELAGSKPRYKTSTTDFESDVDKALFIVAQAKPSKRDSEFMSFLKGLFPGAKAPRLRDAGRQVRANMKGLSPDAEDVMNIPEQEDVLAQLRAEFPEKPSVVAGGADVPDTHVSPTGSRAADTATDAATDARVQTERATGSGPAGGESPAIDPEPSITLADTNIEELADTRAIVDAAAVGYRTTIHTGNSLASLYGDVTRHKMHRAGIGLYDLDKAGGDLAKFGVTPKVAGTSTHWLQVAENMGDYTIPKALREALEYNQTTIHRLMRNLVNIGEAPAEWATKPWQRRIVVKVDGTDVRVGPIKGVGSQQGFSFPRSRATVEVDSNVDYLNSMAGTLEILTREVHHRQAAHDLALQLGLEPKGFLDLVDREGGDVAAAGLALIERRAELGIRKLTTPAELKSAVNKTRNAVKSLEGKLATADAARRKWSKEATRLKNRKATPGQIKKATEKSDKFAQQVKDLRGQLPDARAARDEAKSAAAKARRQVAKPTVKETRIREPLLGGKGVKQETADAFTDQFADPRGLEADVLKVMNRFNNVFRPLWAQIDLSYVGLQALPGIGRNPVAGLNMLGRSVASAAIDPDYYSRWVAQNADVVEDMIVRGKIPWNSSEFAFDPSIGTSKLERAMFERGPYKISQDTWNRALNLMSADLWKQHQHLIAEGGEAVAAKFVDDAFPNLPGVKKARTAAEKAGAAIAHFQGKLSIPETAAQRPITKLRFGALPFAGRYWAGWMKGIASLPRTGPEGAVARRMFAGWITAGVGTYTLFSYATGQEPHLNPFEPRDFLTAKVPEKIPLVGGSKVGVGGPLEQTLVLMGRTAAAARDADSPQDAAKDVAGVVGKWSRGKASPFLSFAADMVTGSTFMGDPVRLDSVKGWVEWVTPKLLPFVAQETAGVALTGALEGQAPGEIKAAVIEEAGAAPATAAGFRGFPESPFEQFNQKAQEMFGVDFDQLRSSEEAQVREAVPRAQRRLELRGERARAAEDVGATAFGISRELTGAHVERLHQAGALVESGELTRGQYRDVVSDIDLLARGQRETVELLFQQAGHDLDDDEPPHDQPKDAREQARNDQWEYFQIFDQYPNADVDPIEKNAMFEAIEGFRAGLGDAREDMLDEDIGVPKKDIPLYQELREDRRALNRANYFKLPDQAWDYLRSQAGIDLPEDYQEYLRQLQAQIGGMISESMPQLADLPPEAFSALTGRDPVVKAYQQVLSAGRTQWMVDHPDLTRLLTLWGYRSALQDLGIIARQQ